MIHEQINQAVDVLNCCEYVVVLTGAGISTESGIPDFRSPVSGLWAKVSPDDFTIQKFLSNPQVFYQLGVDFFKVIIDARPNAAHEVIGELESRGLVRSIITQNIDGLHQKGGAKKVCEIHGSLRKGRCIGCHQEQPMEKLLKDVLKGIIPPLCPRCTAPLKPDVTLFGEGMPPAFQDALDEVRKADGMLVVGSSLVISPANMLPGYVDNLVIVNRETTPLDQRARVVINDSILDVIPLLAKSWIGKKS
ncbi:MAG: Sir2 family NAD-dependent protein deacetylase [Dethiobacteria bacterium]